MSNLLEKLDKVDLKILNILNQSQQYDVNVAIMVGVPYTREFSDRLEKLRELKLLGRSRAGPMYIMEMGRKIAEEQTGYANVESS